MSGIWLPSSLYELLQKGACVRIDAGDLCVDATIDDVRNDGFYSVAYEGLDGRNYGVLGTKVMILGPAAGRPPFMLIRTEWRPRQAASHVRNATTQGEHEIMDASPTRRGRFRNWKDVFVGTLYGINDNHISLYSAGIAFYMLFSLFPALGATTWFLSLLVDPVVVNQIPEHLHHVVPDEAISLIQNQLTALTSNAGTSLSIVAMTNAAIALFTARNAAASMMEALNTIFGAEDTRSIVKFNAVAVMFTAVAICAMVVAIFLILATPAVLALMPPDNSAGHLLRLLRWPVLALLAALALSSAYHYGPNRPKAPWRCFTWGSVTATAIWLAASFGFSWYVSEFNSYNRVYGSLGAVAILLFWFWLTAFAGLAGAQLDKEISERAKARS